VDLLNELTFTKDLLQGYSSLLVLQRKPYAFVIFYCWAAAVGQMHIKTYHKCQVVYEKPGNRHSDR